MALEQKLEVKMLQKLMLTPQLQQAIRLLQMPQLELSQVIANELVENPFLEEVMEDISFDDEHLNDMRQADSLSHSDDSEVPLDGLMGYGRGAEDSTQEGGASEAGGDYAADAEISMDGFMSFGNGSGSATDSAEVPDYSTDPGASLDGLMGFGVDDYFESRSLDGRDLGYFEPDTGEASNYEQFVSQGSDLYDHLSWQLRLSSTTDKVKAAAEVVIGNIDENGYLQSPDEEIAEAAKVNIEIARKAVALLQSFDPPGVAAHNLMECLLLQVWHLGLKGSLVEKIIIKNLKDLEKRKYQAIANEYGVTLEEVKAAVKIIEGLEPKPGRSMSESSPIYIKPDVYIMRDGDDFRIVLNDDSIPSIRINRYYRMLLTNKESLQKDEKEFLNERLRSAMWLLKSLDHRNKTIYRVSECILRFQRDFFEKGMSCMRPLNLKDVAQELDMHESTISRATSNKYLSCHHGLMSFRAFFSSGLQGGDNGMVSSNSVKDTIRKIISEEDPSKPLSDQKIAEMLGAHNIKVARRTVAKYRDELGLSSQSLRKRAD